MVMKLELNQLIREHVTHVRVCVCVCVWVCVRERERDWRLANAESADMMLQSAHVSVNTVIVHHPSSLSLSICC